MNQIRFLHLGDGALTLEFGNTIDQKLVSAISALNIRLQGERDAGRLPGILDTVPTYRSLTVIFDPLALPLSALKEQITRLTDAVDGTSSETSRIWRLPVCYGGEYGPDLFPVAEAKGLSPDDVIRMHSGTAYRVYMIGFLPGFPFMGDVVPELSMPRLTEPRVRVPAGSVAITGQQTAVYPWESPGGWQLLGRCPLTLFDANRAEPALLAPNDQVIFTPATEAEYHELYTADRNHTIDYTRFLDAGGKG